VRGFARSDVGRVRQTNEDVCWLGALEAWPGSFFAAVADGMGGHQWGEVASNLAVAATRQGLEAGLGAARAADAAGTAGTAGTPGAAGGGEIDLGGLLRKAIIDANQTVIAAAAASERPGPPMGTTLSCALVLGDRAAIGHVGDSRAYLVRGAEARLLTVDHSLVGELLRTGDISEREAMVHPHRNVLTRALGTEGDTAPDMVELDFGPGDLLVLCTDGLTSLVAADEIAAAVAHDAASAPDRLVALANERGGHDNVTVMVLIAGPVMGPLPPPRADGRGRQAG